MAEGIPWSQRQKMIDAGELLVAWQAEAVAAGMHISQLNIQVTPVEEGDPATVMLFEWDPVALEHVVRTA